MKVGDLTGKNFGKLTALYRLHNHYKKDTYWLCICECGNLKEVSKSNLRSGNTKSCGCLNGELVSKRFTKHGNRNTRLYKTWQGMKVRCYNKNNPAYLNYGGRGIAVCDEWKDDFQAFYDWAINNGYRDDLTIDRIDNNKSYSPDNCRWIPKSEQPKNRRSNRNITIDGETHCLTEWCKIYNISYRTVQDRLHRGLSIEEALEAN